MRVKSLCCFFGALKQQITNLPLLLLLKQVKIYRKKILFNRRLKKMCCTRGRLAAGFYSSLWFTLQLIDHNPLKHCVFLLLRPDLITGLVQQELGPCLAAKLRRVDLITPLLQDPVQAAKTIFVWVLCGVKCWQVPQSPA